MTTDLLGHQLLARRIAEIPKTAHDFSGLNHPQVIDLSQPVLITGIGSSASHGRYLAQLINSRRAGAAEFRPLSSFLSDSDSSSAENSGRQLVLISQGLSPNARLALSRRQNFASCAVLTSVTEASAARAPELEKLRLELLNERVTLFNFPLENEYQLLLRVVGPFLGYLAVEAAAGASHNAGVDFGALATRAELTAKRVFTELWENVAAPQPFQLLASYPLCEVGENLAFKVMEGLFLSAPPIWDVLHFAHGPLQQLAAVPQPVIYCKQAAEDPRLVSSVRQALKDLKLKLIEIDCAVSGPGAMLELEQIFNYLVLQGMQRFSINQRDWPGKGLDSSLYEIGS